MEYLRKRCGVSFPYARQEPLPGTRDRSLKPSSTVRGLEWETQPAQRAFIGLTVSYVHTAVTPPPALTVVHGKAKEIEAVEGNLRVTPGQISDNEKPEPGRVFPPSQNPVWNLNSAKRQVGLE